MKNLKKNIKMKNLEQAKKLWSDLGDTPIDEEDNIDEDFVAGDITFEKGTDRLDIWYWFEENFNLSVAEDLMTQD